MPGGRACSGAVINLLQRVGPEVRSRRIWAAACAFCVQLFNFPKASAGMANTFSLGGPDPGSVPPRHFLKPAFTYQGLPVQEGH